MKALFTQSLVGFAMIFAVACTQKHTKEEIADIPLCGTVQFEGGCNKELDKSIAYGLALIHHMTYEDADEIFTRVREKDPECFWGPWGIAMSYIHPLWNDAPGAERMKSGAEFSQEALKLAQNEKQRRFAQTIIAYYGGSPGKSEKDRLRDFNSAWENAFFADENDLEAKAFYALSLIAVADPADHDYGNQLKAGRLSEEILGVIPDHPGAFHYIIHAYDVPGLSERALQVAGKYGTIAPEIPHALHMPSHIYTRLGMWDESIDWNSRSAAASLRRNPASGVSTHYFHALDYMMYAHLQKGEHDKAENLLQDIKLLNGPYQPLASTAYALAAAKGRFTLERQDWKGAAAIELPDFPWEKFPEYEALHHFARGLGAARCGDIKSAQKEMERLKELQSVISSAYWVNQVDIQRDLISAWVYFANGSKQEALKLMSAAVDKEWATQKHPITPGELLPAKELYADMLLAVNKPDDALQQYEMSLQRSPNRLNTLFGVATAAEKMGNVEMAKKYHEQIVHLTSAASDEMTKRKKSLAFVKTGK